MLHNIYTQNSSSSSRGVSRSRVFSAYKRTCRINWAERWPPEPGQEVPAHQRSRGSGFHHCVGVSAEGRERGGGEELETWMEREERRKGRARRERERERDGAGGLGGGSVFVLCVKCDHVLELLRQLGSSPAPDSQLLTVNSSAAERSRWKITTRTTLFCIFLFYLELKSHLLILASMTTFTQTNGHLCSRKQTKHFHRFSSAVIHQTSLASVLSIFIFFFNFFLKTLMKFYVFVFLSV